MGFLSGLQAGLRIDFNGVIRRGFKADIYPRMLIARRL